MPGGGVACPSLSSPQQATVPFVLTPQVWKLNVSALTALNVPPGEASWLKRLSPQHVTDPFVLIPQLWKEPAVIAMNVPAGGVAWP
jgi:hypothetical protein